VARHLLDQRQALAVVDREPEHDPEEQPVVEEHEDRAHAGRDPRRERHERHLDVVREHRAREHAALLAREPAIAAG
jgi:hypothetical protein